MMDFDRVNYSRLCIHARGHFYECMRFLTSFFSLCLSFAEIPMPSSPSKPITHVLADPKESEYTYIHIRIRTYAVL